MQDPSVRLRNAIINGNLMIVKRLLSRFPALLTNVDTSNGWSNLHYSAFHKHYMICCHLVSLGHDDREISLTFDKATPTHLAVMGKDIQTLHYLLSKFPSTVDNVDRNGHTPLHYCCVNGFSDALELLAELHSDINFQDKEGNTPLHLALKFGQTKCVKSLIILNCSDDIRNNDNWLALELASSFELQKTYGTLKRSHNDRSLSMTSQKSSDSSTTTSSRRSSESGSPAKKDSNGTVRVLTNPILSIAHKTSSNTLNSQRAHSQSMPPLPQRPLPRRYSNTSLKSSLSGVSTNYANYTYSLSKSSSPTDSSGFQLPMLPPIKPVSMSPNRLNGPKEEAPSSPSSSSMSTRSFRSGSKSSSSKKRSSSFTSTINSILSPLTSHSASLQNTSMSGGSGSTITKTGSPHRTPKIEESGSETEFDGASSVKSTAGSVRHTKSTPSLNELALNFVNNAGNLSSLTQNNSISKISFTNVRNTGNEFDRGYDGESSSSNSSKLLAISGTD